jgi:hypothetical protein
MIVARELPVFHCGIRHGTRQNKPPRKPDTRGHDHAAICRTNQCGKYNQATDTCQIKTAKGKAGSISYLYSNPTTRCPADPPMWKVDNGSDEMEARKGKP